MLTLRVQTLTDEEKDEARRTHPRAAAIIDRCEAMSTETQTSLHGGMLATDGHGLRNDPVITGSTSHDAMPIDPIPEWTEKGPRKALVGSTWVHIGDKVRLRPSRRADAHELFLAGKIATIAEIVLTVDGFGSVVANLILSVDMPDDVTVIDYGIRDIHLAFDLSPPTSSRPSDSSSAPACTRGRTHLISSATAHWRFTRIACRYASDVRLTGKRLGRVGCDGGVGRVNACAWVTGRSAHWSSICRPMASSTRSASWA